MANCKDEFLKETNGKKVLCAEITFERYYYCGDRLTKEAILPIGYSDAAMQDFLQTIDYQYDSGYGVQEVYGTIWYADGTWSEREEYDGEEWWEHRSCPQIPDELKGA